MTSSPSAPCPRCGADASGNFCAACGAPLGQAVCLSCGAPLAPGARFCHKCGTPAGPSAGGIAPPAVSPREDARRPENVPWIIAGVLVVAIIGGVVYSANKRAAPDVPAMANAGNSVGGGAGATGAGGNSAAPCVPSGPAPDISQLTPKQSFTRLVERVTQYFEKGDTACVITFAPMALGAYSNLPATDRDVDARYHTAMLEAQLGMFDNARALADTIMTTSPDNLFGYFIRAAVAEFAGDSAKAQAARAAFRAHYDAELKKNRPEYVEHRPFLEQYRKGDGAK